MNIRTFDIAIESNSELAGKCIVRAEIYANDRIMSCAITMSDDEGLYLPDVLIKIGMHLRASIKNRQDEQQTVHYHNE
jgi:hypothetical protein